MNLTLSETAAALQDAKTLVITAHVNPDGDAIGSSLGLMHVLRSLGKDVTVLLDDDIPAGFSVLPGYDAIRRSVEGETIDCDLFVVLDTMTDRIGKVAEAVRAPRVLNIDHHHTNPGNDKEDLYLDATRAATCEIIYDLAKEMNVAVSKDAAMCLYTGLATDTGFFRFSNAVAHTYRAAADLIDAGAQPNVISEALEIKPMQTVKDLGEALAQFELFADGKAAGIFLTQEQTARMASTEAFIGHIRVIDGVDVAVVLKCKEPNVCRVSMRSKHVDVSRIATMYDGGGHIRAAGCTLKMPFEQAKTTIMAAIETAIREGWIA
ncbi:bifunctional oligoribonuclease/PAP phosphatase NrnA [uncultured Selenomonas sp.]|uniref:DHH family phosphoesterase n=1 Tax=uncultured Selenomonas sp. TaxID=159275 RepID=UPI0025DBB145|nr:bifunctional oligoribonuclease/PAP phosphatase NrnA [uncultured Selenomonas sp.]